MKRDRSASGGAWPRRVFRPHGAGRTAGPSPAARGTCRSILNTKRPFFRLVLVALGYQRAAGTTDRGTRGPALQVRGVERGRNIFGDVEAVRDVEGAESAEIHALHLAIDV